MHRLVSCPTLIERHSCCDMLSIWHVKSHLLLLVTCCWLILNCWESFPSSVQDNQRMCQCACAVVCLVSCCTLFIALSHVEWLPSVYSQDGSESWRRGHWTFLLAVTVVIFWVWVKTACACVQKVENPWCCCWVLWCGSTWSS